MSKVVEILANSPLFLSVSWTVALAVAVALATTFFMIATEAYMEEDTYRYYLENMNRDTDSTLAFETREAAWHAILGTGYSAETRQIFEDAGWMVVKRQMLKLKPTMEENDDGR